MVMNYIKSALRNTLRHKGYSLINIVGLAVGIAGSLAVFLWVIDEIGYDDFHANGASIYRCYRQVIHNGELRADAMTSAPVGPAIGDRAPGVRKFARTYGEYRELGYETEAVLEYGLYTDAAFLTMFSFPLIQGDPLTALSAPNSVILTQRTAQRLFGDRDPMGKILDNGLAVTGIAADVPRQSSIEFDFLIPMAAAEQAGLIASEEWWNFGCATYLLLHEQTRPEEVGSVIRDLFAEVDSETTLKLYLQPLADIHLRGLNGGGRIVYVYVFSIVAVLLLAVACVNFMNLATARSARRTIEIGLRKAVGASRWQLIWQILTESIVQTITAMILALCLLEAALPWLENLFGKTLKIEFTGGLILGLMGITALVALAAGSYPAVVLSSFRPATVLKRVSTATGHGHMSRIRKILVVFQFTVSTGLIIAALVIYNQLNLIENKDLGIDRENIVCVRADGLENDHDALKSELRQYPGILGVTAVFQPPARCGWHAVGFDYEGKPEDEDIRSGVAWIDHDYVELFGLEIVRGRNFSKQFTTDETQGYLVNEAAVRAMGMDDPIGKTLDMGDRPGTIVGVVRDFHFASLHDPIGPLALGIDQNYYEYLCIKVAEDDINGSLAFIERTWSNLRAGENFQYRFFDDMLGREYRADMRTGRIVLGFTLVTVLVACLGLFGLAAYSAERRTKEIGIRKVLGSSVAGIIGLLTREFVILVVLGNIIAAPLAWYLAERWLEGFAYRIEPGWGIFTLSGGLAIVIALVTVCYQAIRAARANPVEALKYE